MLGDGDISRAVSSSLLRALPPALPGLAGAEVSARAKIAAAAASKSAAPPLPSSKPKWLPSSTSPSLSPSPSPSSSPSSPSPSPSTQFDTDAAPKTSVVIPALSLPQQPSATIANSLAETATTVLPSKGSRKRKEIELGGADADARRFSFNATHSLSLAKPASSHFVGAVGSDADSSSAPFMMPPPHTTTSNPVAQHKNVVVAAATLSASSLNATDGPTSSISSTGTALAGGGARVVHARAARRWSTSPASKRVCTKTLDAEAIAIKTHSLDLILVASAAASDCDRGPRDHLTGSGEQTNAATIPARQRRTGRGSQRRVPLRREDARAADEVRSKLQSTSSEGGLETGKKDEPAQSFPCIWGNECDMVFNARVSLAVHVGEHTAQASDNACRWRDCKVRGKIHRQASWLLLHVTDHTGVRQHPCPMSGCDRTFSTPSALEKHVQRHFTAAKVKPEGSRIKHGGVRPDVVVLETPLPQDVVLQLSVLLSKESPS